LREQLVVFVTTAVELRPALHAQFSVLIMRKLLRTSRGMELKGKRERKIRGEGERKRIESGEAWSEEREGKERKRERERVRERGRR
jgi:hypothetical protein